MAAEVYFDVPHLDACESDFADMVKINGTNVDMLVGAFDSTTEEYRNGSFFCPTNIGTGNVTFRAFVYAATAASSVFVALRFGHLARNDSEPFDAAYTNEDSGDKAIDATQGDWSEITWTETVANLGWTANEQILFRVSRYTPTGTNLTGDMYWKTFAVEMPTA